MKQLTHDQLVYLDKHWREITKFKENNKINSMQEALSIYESTNTIKGYR